MRLREGDVGNVGRYRAGNDHARLLPVANPSTAPPFNAPLIDVSTPDSLPHACTRRAADHVRRGRRRDPTSPTQQDPRDGLIAGQRGGAARTTACRNAMRFDRTTTDPAQRGRPGHRPMIVPEGEHGDLEARHHEREVEGSAATPPPGFGSWDVIQRLRRTQRGCLSRTRAYCASASSRTGCGNLW